MKLVAGVTAFGKGAEKYDERASASGVGGLECVEGKHGRVLPVGGIFG